MYLWDTQNSCQFYLDKCQTEIPNLFIYFKVQETAYREQKKENHMRMLSKTGNWKGKVWLHV
jgi:hypothetical protein